MGVNGITNQSLYYEQAASSGSVSKAASDSSKENKKTLCDTYEKSEDTETDSTKQIYSSNTAVVERLKADMEQRKQQLADLVEKTIGKQSNKFSSLSDLFNQIKNGTISVDQSVVEQAQNDVAEDGYWGVEQTSDRLVEFAKALSGGDPSKADEMISAVKDGFEKATNAWGDTLPDISQQTLDATLKKLDEWKNEQNSNEE